ncbi:MAG: GDSL-type esterase/lipase family protein [Planctomycetota bacterium]
MKILLRLLLAMFGVLIALVALELALRGGMIDEDNLHAEYELYFETEDRIRFENAEDGGQYGLIVPDPNNPRQPAFRFAPNATFYLCYSGLDGERAAYFDERGCVECATNSLGMREREELAGPKPDGQTRVLCIGDSFTFGWGVKVEDAWPRRVERELRRQDDSVRTVNAGAAGAIFVDEYYAALDERFHVVEPDVVVFTICLNDILPTSLALAHHRSKNDLPWIFRVSKLARRVNNVYPLQDVLTLDPEHDYIQDLFDSPDEVYQWPLWPAQKGREGFWVGGGPQEALIAARDWCQERGKVFGVAIWPYFQGLGPDEWYPFTRIHTLVGEFCLENDIPFCDVLPELVDKVSTHELWVSPADYHGNARAQEMATPKLTAWIDSLIRMIPR